ncbi:MAG: DUF819 family protein [Spirochaetaceae bacterium]|jgi:uncharacterized membrane protein|nr:DUF819 family protein [Spirochaetaceae bacterium]
MSTLVQAGDAWVLWALLFLFATISIFLEQRYKWAERLSGPVIGLILAILAVNFRIIPTASPVYDAVWDYFIPLSVAMLLFRANIKSIIKDTGKMFLCFNISAIGTLIGVIIAFFLLKNFIPELDKMAGILTGSYIGGGVNLFAVASSTQISETMLSAEVVADNFVMALVIFVLLWIPSSNFFKKRYNHPYQTQIEARGKDDRAKTMAAAFWGRKDISLLDIAITVATAFVIVTVATKIAGAFKTMLDPGEGAGFWTGLPALILGNQYVLLTVVSVLATSLFPKFFENLKGAQEIGTYLIYVFFVVIGCPADLKDVIFNAPLLFVFCGLIAFINIGWTLLIGKLFKQNIEELTIASNANIGGPSTAAAMAVAKGYDMLVVAAILVGLWGYIIGTPLGLIVARWFSAFVP